MELFVLADVDYEDFIILGVFSSFERAQAKVSGVEPEGRSFWIERWGLDESSAVQYKHWVRNGNDRNWEEK